MKKFKIILVGLFLVFSHYVAFTMEKSSEKINLEQKTINLKELNNLKFKELEFILKINDFLKNDTIEIFENGEIKKISFNSFKEYVKNKLEQKLENQSFDEENQIEIFIPNIVQNNELKTCVFTLKILKNKTNVELLSCIYDEAKTNEIKKLNKNTENKKFGKHSFKNIENYLIKTNFLINNKFEIIEKNNIKKIDFCEFKNIINKKLEENFYKNEKNPIIIKNVIKKFNNFKVVCDLHIDLNENTNQIYLKKILENFELPFQDNMPPIKTDMDKILIKKNNYEIITKRQLAKNSFFSKEEENLIKKTLNADDSLKNFLLILNTRIDCFLKEVFDFSKDINTQIDNFSVIDASEIFHIDFEVKSKKINYPEFDYTPPIFEENDFNKHILTITLSSPINQFKKITLEQKLIAPNLKLSEKNKTDILNIFPNLGKTKNDYNLNKIENLIAKNVEKLNLKPMKKGGKKDKENTAKIEIEILYETYRNKFSTNVWFKHNGIFYDEFCLLKK